jgi:hypothetical protein
MIAFYRMVELKLQRFLHWPCTLYITTIISACSLLCASLLPWLKDPLGGIYSAWQLPLYSGLSYHIAFLNYGLLCSFGAIYIVIYALTDRQPYRKYNYFVYGRKIKRCIPIILVALFLFQYLCTDVTTLALLTTHERQMLLIQMYFGYKGDNQIITLNPLSLNISTLWTKFQLLLNCLSYGPLFLCASTWLLPVYHHSATHPVHSVKPQHKRKLVIVCAALVILFGPVPL